jgi:hypothetical protein
MERAVLAVLIGMSMFVCASAPAQTDDSLSHASLDGLEGVFVRVHFSGVPDQKDGLTAEQLWSDITLRLQAADVNVLSDTDWEKTEGKPYLYLNIEGEALSPQNNARDGFVYTCSLNLMQQVTLARKPHSKVFASTWSRGSSVVVVGHDLSIVREVVGDIASQFTNELTSARKGTTQRIGEVAYPPNAESTLHKNKS